jgi:hypothetical protein
LAFALYGISEEDREAIVNGLGADNGAEDPGENPPPDPDDPEAEDGAVLELDSVGLAAGLVSWAVGVTAGRFDVRMATGDRACPAEPDPFDPMPVCSAGMLTGEDGLPAAMPPDAYPVEVSSILVEDPGHPLDVTEQVRSVFDVVFGSDSDRWWTDVGATLDPRTGEVGAWLSRGLFEHHLKMYSKSRRKAPILWPLGTKSGSYRVWLYAHRVTGDSLFRLLNDYVTPKMAVEERKLTELRQVAGGSPTASQRRGIDGQQRFISELREFRDELEAIAPLWAPDLNDGVVIVLAPLWQLFASHRSWSNELKRHWVKLAKGDYDWAQLAMQLWPERVVPKCATDRSLAIAHTLEDVFWIQDPDNPAKWRPRSSPTIPTAELINERHNHATKAALQRTTVA